MTHEPDSSNPYASPSTVAAELSATDAFEQWRDFRPDFTAGLVLSGQLNPLDVTRLQELSPKAARFASRLSRYAVMAIIAFAIAGGMIAGIAMAMKYATPELIRSLPAVSYFLYLGFAIGAAGFFIFGREVRRRSRSDYRLDPVQLIFQAKYLHSLRRDRFSVSHSSKLTADVAPDLVHLVTDSGIEVELIPQRFGRSGDDWQRMLELVRTSIACMGDSGELSRTRRGRANASRPHEEISFADQWSAFKPAGEPIVGHGSASADDFLEPLRPVGGQIILFLLVYSAVTIAAGGLSSLADPLTKRGAILAGIAGAALLNGVAFCGVIVFHWLAARRVSANFAERLRPTTCCVFDNCVDFRSSAGKSTFLWECLRLRRMTPLGISTWIGASNLCIVLPRRFFSGPDWQKCLERAAKLPRK